MQVSPEEAKEVETSALSVKVRFQSRMFGDLRCYLRSWLLTFLSVCSCVALTLIV